MNARTHIPDKVKVTFRLPEEAARRAVDQWRNPETDDEQQSNERLVIQHGVFSIDAVPGAPDEIVLWKVNFEAIAFEEIDTLWITLYRGRPREWHLGGGRHYLIAFRSREAAEREAGKFPRKKGMSVEWVSADLYTDETIVLDGKIVTVQAIGEYYSDKRKGAQCRAISEG